MIALTQEQREELTFEVRKFLDENTFLRSTVEKQVYEIALASLTAEPVLQIQKESYNNNVWIDAESEKEATANQCHGYKNRKLYPAPPVPEIKLPRELLEISNSLNTQDNRCTDQPMFIVYQKREVIGSDDHSPSRIVWVVDGDEVSENKARRLEALHQECRDIDSKYDRYAMQEINEFVTACFTEQGCKDFIAINGHNLRRPFIFAEGSYRNHEYQAVRNWLVSLNGLGE